jgi:hypothetical protein
MEITYNTDKFTKLMETKQHQINDGVTQGLQEFFDHAKQMAKAIHRFKNRTGKLERSIKTRVYKYQGKIYIDDNIAPYGIYVHEGHGTWLPDRFIDDSVDQEYLQQLINKNIRRNLRK